MRGGVSFPFYAPTFTLAAGSAVTGYGVSNLAEKRKLSSVFKAAAGAVTIAFDLGAEQQIQMVGLARHNAAAGATMQVQLFDGGSSLTYDSGVTPFYPTTGPVSWLCQHSINVADAAVACRTGTIALSSHATGWSIGACVPAGWWLWDDVSVPREIGVSPMDMVNGAADGTDDVTSQWRPRRFAVQRFLPDVEPEQDMMRDFHVQTGIHTPYFYAWDYDDPDTWVRQIAFVTNASILPLQRGDYPSGRFKIDALEHLA